MRRRPTAILSFTGAQERLIEHTALHFHKQTQFDKKNATNTLSEEFKPVALEN